MNSISLRHQKTLSLAIIVLGAAWIWITALAFEGTTNGAIPAPKEDFQAPDFSLQTASGEPYQLSNLRGKVVLVNIWTSWCPPCKAEMPAMQDVYETYQDQGFIILAVNATFQDSVDKATEFARVHDLTFPILMDTEGTVTNRYQVHSYPTSFFIDPAGLVNEVVIGGPMAETLLRTRVENLIKGVD